MRQESLSILLFSIYLIGLIIDLLSEIILRFT